MRIMLVSSQDMPIGAKPVYLDVDLAQLTVGETTPSERYVLPFDGTMLTKDKKIQFLIYNPNAAVTLDASACSVLIDMKYIETSRKRWRFGKMYRQAAADI